MKPKAEVLMTLRDYFASCALQAMLIKQEKISIDPNLFANEAALAYAAADAMIAERAKK